MSACLEAPAPEAIEGPPQPGLTQDLEVGLRNSGLGFDGRWLVSATCGDQGVAWLAADFVRTHAVLDYDNWRPASGPFGFGEADVDRLHLGASPLGPPTVYAINEFIYRPSVEEFRGLRLEAMYDDGIVVYLNGVEVARRNLQRGPVTYATRAARSVEADVYQSIDLGEHLDLLNAGDNTIQVEIHQSDERVSAWARGSSDLVFDGHLIAQVLYDPPPPAQGGIRQETEWSYWDAGGDPGSAWANPQYQPLWRVGRAPFGYGAPYLRTPVDDGHITTYLRRDFDVPDPTAIAGMHGDLLYNDGVIVYLNGHEIGRHSMPGGPITAATLAFEHPGNEELERYDWTPYTHLLVAGRNTLAVELHQNSASSDSLVFDAALTFDAVPPPPASTTVARASSWSYWDQGGDLGAAWRSPGFADGAWATGSGPLGYGETYVATTVGYGPDPAHKHPTTYVRKRFDLTFPPGQRPSRLIAEVMHDDGLVMYVNGQEVKRLQMPSGAVNAMTPGVDREAHGVYDTFDLTAYGDLLVPGENVLAVEVHQTSPSSDDLVIDVGLSIEYAVRFGRFAGNPVLQTAHGSESSWDRAMHAPQVIKAGPGSWEMFFTGSDQGGNHDMILHAHSTDGVSWDLAHAGGVTHGHLMSALYDGTLWRVYYRDLWNDRIDLYTSADGVHFTYQGVAMPQVSDARVIQDGGVFKMWFSRAGGLGYATSTDGLSFTVQPVSTTGTAGLGNIVKDGGVYKMWVGDDDTWDAPPCGIRYLTSPDGLAWTPHGMSLTCRRDLPWETRTCSSAFVLRDEGILKMWYTGRNWQDHTIGYATEL